MWQSIVEMKLSDLIEGITGQGGGAEKCY